MKGYDSPSIAVMTVAVVIVMFMAVAALFGIHFFRLIESSASKQLDIFLLNNGMRSAKLYMGQSLNYSVGQALYDNAKRGGFSSESEIDSWPEGGPSEDVILENLEAGIEKNMLAYTSGGFMFLGRKFSLPTLNRNQITATRQDGGIKVSAMSSEKIKYSETQEEELGISKVVLRMNADMISDIETEYFRLIDAGRKIHGELEGKSCGDLEEGEVVIEKTVDGFGSEAAVEEKAETEEVCSATVKVTVTGSEEIPVYEEGVKFVPVTLIYSTVIQ